MPDIITTAGAAGPDGAAVVSQPGEQVPTPEARIAAATAAAFGAPPPKPAAEVPKPAAEQAAEKAPDLASVIRAQREARQAAQQEAQRRSTIEQELKAARTELERAKADRLAFENDPVGYAKERGWSKEQQLLYGQSLLYDLAPDKADPDFRIKMFEDRQKREEGAKAKAAQEAAAKEAQARQVAQVQEFYQDTAAAVRSFEAGSYPESEDWFGDDADSYMQSLMATAQNLAARATREGRVADLSPGALAAALEAETARRTAARDERRQKRIPATARAAAPVPPVGGVQAAETMSTRNMNGAGAPQPPATSEKERIQRAVAAAFRVR